MRAVVSGLVVGLAWTMATTATAAAAGDRATVRVRIHDYVAFRRSRWRGRSRW